MAFIRASVVGVSFCLLSNPVRCAPGEAPHLIVRDKAQLRKRTVVIILLSDLCVCSH